MFGATERAVGEAVIAKLGSAVTFRVKFAVSVVPPLVPVMVTVAGPTVAVFVAVKVRVLPAEPLSVAGLKVAVTPAGSPAVTIKSTVPVKPPTELSVTLLVPVCPCITLAPLALRAKPGPAGMFGTTGKEF